MQYLKVNITWLALIVFLTITKAQTTSPEFPIPKSITVDKNLSATQVKMLKETALSYYAFWNTGKKEFLDRAVSPSFIDNTLPKGRPQGPKGPLFASDNFRKAVPDLKCIVNDLLIMGEKVTVRMQFIGTFTGSFNDIKGNNQKVNFLAIDILHIKEGKIVEDWHLEDNLTLMQQLGVVK